MQEEIKKAESEFYVVRAINKVAENATAAIMEYNENVVKKAVESGRVFADEARKNTMEAVAGIVEDGKKVMARIPMVENIAPKPAEADDAEFYVIKTFQKAAEEATAALKDYNQAVKKTFENPRELIEGKRAKAIESGKLALENGKALLAAAKKTANEAIEGVTADGKKLAAQATETVTNTRTLVKTKAQNAIDGGLSVVTRALDLPTRTDIVELTAAVTEFNKKADLILAAQAA